MLDDYKEYIDQRLQEYPLTAARIYREIQEQGFEGKYTIVKDYVRETRPKVGVPAVYRYETKPGVQAQVPGNPLRQHEADRPETRTQILGFGLEFEVRGLLHTLRICTPPLPSLPTSDERKDREHGGIREEGFLHGRQVQIFL